MGQVLHTLADSVRFESLVKAVRAHARTDAHTRAHSDTRAHTLSRTRALAHSCKRALTQRVASDVHSRSLGGAGGEPSGAPAPAPTR